MTNDGCNYVEKRPLQKQKTAHKTNISAHEAQRSDTPFLYFTVATGILPMLVNASSAVWTSPAVVKLQSNSTSENVLERPITTAETSLLLGVPGIVGLIGSSLLPKLADLMGRKRSLQLTSTGILFTTIGLAFSEEITVIVFFQSIFRFFIMGISSIMPTYLTEICENHNRSKHGCFIMLSVPLGQLYMLAIGSATAFKYFTLLMGAPMVLFLILFYFAPESPVYSLSKGKTTECVETLRKLRSNKLEKELDIDLSILKKSIVVTEDSKFSLNKLFSTKEGRIGLLLATLPLLVQALCGVQVITSLMAPIFNDSGSNFSGNTIALIVGGIKLIMFTFTSCIVEKIGRKPLLLVSAVAAGISISILGIFFYLKYIDCALLKQLQWGPLVCISAFAGSYSLGLGPIPVGIMGELFTWDIRTTGVAVASTIGTAMMPVYGALYPILAEMIGTHWCMWIFGGLCFTGAFLICVLLPETKGKSEVEIQELLKNYTFFWCNFKCWT